MIKNNKFQDEINEWWELKKTYIKNVCYKPRVLEKYISEEKKRFYTIEDKIVSNYKYYRDLLSQEQQGYLFREYPTLMDVHFLS